MRAAAGVILLLGIAFGRGDAFASPDAPQMRGATDTGLVRLVLALGDRRLYVEEVDAATGARHIVESYPVAVGRAGYETPIGSFRVREKIADPDFVQFDWANPSFVTGRIAPGRGNPLGARWIGFTTAYGWAIGFHGTPQPELLGRAVSHGCVRMRNRDVIRLYDLVSVGTPVVVEP